MALFRFTPTLDPINALLNLQRDLDRVFDNPLGLDLGLSGRGVFPAINVFSSSCDSVSGCRPGPPRAAGLLPVTIVCTWQLAQPTFANS